MPVVEVRYTSDCQDGMHSKFEANEQDTAEPELTQRHGTYRQSSRRGGHARIEARASQRPYHQSDQHLRQASSGESGSDAVQERELDEVPAKGEPQGEGGDGKDEPEIMSLEREHSADGDGN